jgi:hypothetical protein
VANRLLAEFENSFKEKIYRHRSSNTGDRIASFLYEDLVDLGRTSDRFPELVSRVDSGRNVLNTLNLVKGQRLLQGKTGRRGDGTFGELVPGEMPVPHPGFSVRRGPVANVEIGIEMKVVAKAMAKQLDRVISGVRHQADVFRKLNTNAITIAIIGINYADVYDSYEGERVFTGKPSKEAQRTYERLEREVDNVDELILLPFKATNRDPFPFEWHNPTDVAQRYNAALVRIGNLYRTKFSAL